MFRPHHLTQRWRIVAICLMLIITVSGVALFYFSQQSPAQPNPYQDIFGQPVSINGHIECLPHKNKSGPQTLECAFGMQGDDGYHYGLSSLDQDTLINGTISVGKYVSASGIIDQPDKHNQYDIVGTIDIDKISVIDQ